MSKLGRFLCAVGFHRWEICPIVPFQFAPKAQCQRCGAICRIDSQGMPVLVCEPGSCPSCGKPVEQNAYGDILRDGLCQECYDRIPPGPAL